MIKEGKREYRNARKVIQLSVKLGILRLARTEFGRSFDTSHQFFISPSPIFMTSTPNFPITS